MRLTSASCIDKVGTNGKLSCVVEIGRGGGGVGDASAAILTRVLGILNSFFYYLFSEVGVKGPVLFSSPNFG